MCRGGANDLPTVDQPVKLERTLDLAGQVDPHGRLPDGLVTAIQFGREVLVSARPCSFESKGFQDPMQRIGFLDVLRSDAGDEGPGIGDARQQSFLHQFPDRLAQRRTADAHLPRDAQLVDLLPGLQLSGQDRAPQERDDPGPAGRIGDRVEIGLGHIGFAQRV